MGERGLTFFYFASVVFEFFRINVFCSHHLKEIFRSFSKMKMPCLLRAQYYLRRSRHGLRGLATRRHWLYDLFFCNK